MIVVTSVPPTRRLDALRVLFCRHSPSERQAAIEDILAAGDRREFCLDGLLLAESAGVPAGAVFYALQPDATAFVWPPVVCPSADDRADEVADALLQQVCRQVDRAGAKFGQCLLELDASAERAALVRNGFVHLADLSFLERDLSARLPPAPSTELQTDVYCPEENSDRFARMIERTYVGTQDCPRLNGARSGRESLASHRLQGEFHPSRWRVFRRGGEDVGVLLLSAHPDRNAWEVVYVGVAPEARGWGLGREMLLGGLYEAKRAGCKTVFLAVDRQNDCARRIYAELGFVEVNVRAVHVRMQQFVREF